MYAVMAGSYCPTSCADIARSTRGSALIGPGPISRRCGGLICAAVICAVLLGSVLLGAVLIADGMLGITTSRD